VVSEDLAGTVAAANMAVALSLAEVELTGHKMDSLAFQV